MGPPTGVRPRCRPTHSGAAETEMKFGPDPACAPTLQISPRTSLRREHCAQSRQERAAFGHTGSSTVYKRRWHIEDPHPQDCLLERAALDILGKPRWAEYPATS